MESSNSADQVVTATGEVRHVCWEGGYLVGGEYRMGAPHHYRFKDFRNVVGCSMLQCDVCHAVVVNILGHKLSEGVLPCNAYWEPGSSPDPKMVVPAKWAYQRFYCCHCYAYGVMGSTITKPSPPHDYMDVILRWRCMGHPELPRYVDGKDQRIAADELLSSPVSQGGHFYTTDDLQLMLRAADAELHEVLLALLRETLTHGEGMRLSRALTVVNAEPTAFVRQLASIQTDDSRLTVPDTVCAGWTLRDRFSHAVASCIMGADAWWTLRPLAIELFPGTLSWDLIKVMNEHEPNSVICALLEGNEALRSQPSRNSSRI